MTNSSFSGIVKEGISLVTIVLNEEKYINRFLDYALSYLDRKYVDELVVVDGLSIDRTVSICLDRKVNVITHPFCFHFGDQRNFAITQTHYNWILMLDVDEYLEEHLVCDLKELIKTTEYDAFKIPRKNLLDLVEDKSVYPDLQVRLFKRHCRWIYPIHEELVGFKKAKVLEGRHIVHVKDSQRHQERNLYFYPFLEKIWGLS